MPSRTNQTNHPAVEFACHLDRFGDAPALVTSSETVTYRELNERVERQTVELGGI